MDHKEIRRKFIEFFVDRGHLEVPSSSLVPDYDPTVLLTNSGMAPLKSYFLGLAKPPSRKITNVQRCVRTNDIESVGDIHHLTFFEMMGNWSIGDSEALGGIGPSGYFKKEAINFAWDLLSEFGIDKTRIWAGVFGGDSNWPNVPCDEESFSVWKNLLPQERILKLPSKDSFWFSGHLGPCGPNTDILYDLGPEHACGKPDCGPNCDCGRFLEIWNAGVFMMYNRLPDGSFETLSAKSVDAGAGLERFAMVLQGVGSVYETDIFKGLMEDINALAEVRHTVDQRSVRIIADHTRAVTFLASDGVTPSNTQQGYV
ncbi:MAG: alanine--tRNA ligase-related protein, partial [Patescibacteria group bacterium]|nr:alanine--tRNA ligase-related protein [Patescibacteria group bacterium]